VGGLALIGVAVVAAIIGLATLAINGADTQPTAAPTPGPSPTPTAAPLPTEAPPGAAPGESPEPATPGAPAPGAPGAPAAPDKNGAAAGVPKDAQVSGDGDARTAGVHAPVRVYNNSTIPGLAARAAEDFRQAGWPVEEVANYPYGVIPTSTVYYRPGTDEESPARALGEQFRLRVEPRFEGLRDASPGLIVIVTNDYER
jgi:hypothetical protein